MLYQDSIDAVISKTKEHIIKLYGECGSMEYFGRSTVEQIINLKSTRASELIKLMLEYDIINPVQGRGKGKYCFKYQDGWEIGAIVKVALCQDLEQNKMGDFSN